MHTHSSDPILVLPGSQVLPPSFVGLSIEGSLEDCCRDVGNLKRAWDILLSENEPVLPYSYSGCRSGFMKTVCWASQRRAGNRCHPAHFSIFIATFHEKVPEHISFQNKHDKKNQRNLQTEKAESTGAFVHRGHQNQYIISHNSRNVAFLKHSGK